MSTKIRWSRRVAPQQIRRLYENDAQGMLDEDLLDDVGYRIYARCQDILELAEANRGRVKCHGCGNTILRRIVDGQFDESEIEKLLLIDRLIHEWHIHYRAVGWPLGTAVVKATGTQMVELLEGLAYGPRSAAELRQCKEVWRSRLEARRMTFDLEATARALGIKGISRMRKRELIDAIEHVEPGFFRAWLDLVYGEVTT